jgi:hypothetical protein
MFLPSDLLLQHVFSFLAYHDTIPMKRTCKGLYKLHGKYTFLLLQHEVYPRLRHTRIGMEDLWKIFSCVTPYHPLDTILTWLGGGGGIILYHPVNCDAPYYGHVLDAYMELCEGCHFLLRHALHAHYLGEFRGEIPDYFKSMSVRNLSQLLHEIQHLHERDKKWLMKIYDRARKMYIDDEHRYVREYVAWSKKWGNIRVLYQMKRKLF